MDGDGDGWPEESICLPRAVHVCILMLGPGLAGMPAVLHLPSCCHLSLFADKWTHFTA